MALSTACFTGNAFADSKNVDIYGTISFYGFHNTPKNGVGSFSIENESNIGFRGNQLLPQGPKLLWQIESSVGGDKIGNRDTFVGLEGEFGKVRAGRMLTAVYETIDWPFSNPGLGPVFDWGHGDVLGGGNLDRQSNQVRWDSPSFGPLTVSLSGGRTNTTVVGASFFSGIAHIKLGSATLHAGFERDNGKQFFKRGGDGSVMKDASGKEITSDVTASANTALVAVEMPLAEGLNA